MEDLLTFIKEKILKQKQRKSTLELLNQDRTNKEEQRYKLFDSENNRDESLQYISNCLDSMRTVLKELTSTQNQDLVDKHFEKTISRFSSIRIDKKDKDIFPMKLIYDEFTQNGNINFEDKKHDGVTRSVLDDGIMILIPELYEEIKENKSNNTNKINAIHTLVHEVLHAMSNRIVIENGRKKYITGMQLYGNDNIFDDLNEGLNEYFTRKIMQQMYPNQQIEERYIARTQTIEAFMKGLDQITQNKIFESYISGNFDQVLNNFFTKFQRISGENLLLRLENLRIKGFRITASDDKLNMQSAQMFIDGLKDFKEQSKTSQQIM